MQAMKVYKPPHPAPEGRPRLFLAGSIEMGTADDWQERVEEMLEETDWVVLNPRHESWDPSWEQREDAGPFRNQVEWELAGLESADRILMYFSPETKSPISLLELGLFARSSKLLVVCPEGFWRKGNVDIVCISYNIQKCETLEEAIGILKTEAANFI